MAADESTTREVWLAVARAAADHRRIVGPEDRVFYDDLTLRRTGYAHAWEQRRRAILHGLDAGVPVTELVDALLSGDPRLDHGDAPDLIEWERHRDERLAKLNEWVLRDLFEERE